MTEDLTEESLLRAVSKINEIAKQSNVKIHAKGPFYFVPREANVTRKEEPIFSYDDFKISYPPIGDFIESEYVTERVVDWSACRSPSRARRRERMGHKQRVVRFDKPACYQAGDNYYIHPKLLREMKARMAKRIEKTITDQIFGVFNAGN